MNRTLQQKLVAARQASCALAQLSTRQKNQVLKKVARALWKKRALILKANAQDLRAVPADYQLTDRLRLTAERIKVMVTSLEAVSRLPDPVGEVLERIARPTGLHIERVRVPFGVIGVIYEARPNVTTEVFSLTFKTGNSLVLKGGRDAFHTSRALIHTIQQVLRAEGLSPNGIVRLDPTDRRAVADMLTANGLIDVVIPRGGKGLIEYVRQQATIPVIETGVGVCHTLVERSASMPLAVRVVINAKTRRCTVCNALDCLVLERAVAKKFLMAFAPIAQQHRLALQADAASYKILRTIYPPALLQPATATDFATEFLSLRMAIKTVPDFRAGLDFIQHHTSHHSEAVITQNKTHARQFTQQIDAAVVYVNTPTTFTDGFEFGLGAEIGVSTQKLHARGPMSLRELTTYKWVVRSHGAIRQG